MAVAVEVLTAADAKVAQLGPTECDCQTVRQINGEWRISLSYPVPPAATGDDKSAYFLQGYKLRVKNFDTLATTTFIITAPVFERQQNGVIVKTIEGDHESIVAFSQKVMNAYGTFTNRTPTYILTYLVGFLTGYTVGTVQPTALVTMQYVGWETIMSALQKLLAACGGELSVSSAKAISIYSTMGSDNGVRLNVGKNIESVKNTRYWRKIANLVYGVGGGTPPQTIGGARHVVKSIATTTITVSGNKVVPENDSWNTYKVKFLTGAQAGNSVVINDCTHGATDDTLVLASDLSASVVAGDKFSIVTSAGADVTFLRAGTSITSYGSIESVFKDERYTDATNLIETPALDGTYTANLCASWTKVATPTLLENLPDTGGSGVGAAFIKYGSKSQKVLADAANEGISQVVVVTAGRYYRVVLWAYVVTGSVVLSVTDGTNPAWEFSKTATGWQKIEIFEKFTSASLTVKVLSLASGNDFYVDAVQVTEGALERSFTANSNLKDLWDKTFDSIMKTKDPLFEYSVSFIDLNKIDPVAYPYEAIALGDTLTIYDVDLGINGLTARVKEIITDEFNPQKTRHVVSNII